MKLRIVKCTDDKLWDNFILNSASQSVYAVSDYLKISNREVDKMLCFKDMEILASFILIKKDTIRERGALNKNSIIREENVLFTPITYRRIKGSSNAKKIRERYFINGFIVNYLVENFESISLALDYETDDIRHFLWHGFPDYKKKFLVEPRFTTLLNLDYIDNDNFLESKLFYNFSSTFRNNYRRSLKDNFILNNQFSKEIFFSLLHDTFESQNIIFDVKSYEKIFEVLKNLYQKNLIDMMYLTNKNNEVFNFILFSTVGNKSTILFSGKSSFVGADDFCGVYLNVSLFLHLKKNNFKIVDLEGINSPTRGFNKLGYGGSITPYYNLVLN